MLSPPQQVGNNFGNINVTQFLTKFASQPSSEYVKVLDSFEKLSGLFKEIQTKIYTIEGAQDAPSSGVGPGAGYKRAAAGSWVVLEARYNGAASGSGVGTRGWV